MLSEYTDGEILYILLCQKGSMLKKILFLFENHKAILKGNKNYEGKANSGLEATNEYVK